MFFLKLQYEVCEYRGAKIQYEKKAYTVLLLELIQDTINVESI